jgi:hypothetical protein
MSQPNLGALRAVADRLDNLGLDYAFVGGSIVNLLLDNSELSPARPTHGILVWPYEVGREEQRKRRAAAGCEA